VLLDDRANKNDMTKKNDKFSSFSMRLLRYLPDLKSLKHLELDIKYKTHPDVLKRLILVMPKIISSQQTLQIWLEVSPTKYEDGDFEEDNRLFSSFVENTDVSHAPDSLIS